MAVIIIYNGKPYRFLSIFDKMPEGFTLSEDQVQILSHIWRDQFNSFQLLHIGVRSIIYGLMFDCPVEFQTGPNGEDRDSSRKITPISIPRINKK